VTFTKDGDADESSSEEGDAEEEESPKDGESPDGVRGVEVFGSVKGFVETWPTWFYVAVRWSKEDSTWVPQSEEKMSYWWLFQGSKVRG
jgi:hypothetical protein